METETEELKSPTKQVREIDDKKLILEARFEPKIKRLFRQIGRDIASLLEADENVNAYEIALNYKPDFIALLRQLYRDTIKVFGFSLRQEAEKKFNISLSIEREKESFINLCTKQETFEIRDDQEKEINTVMLRDTTLYVNNHSEEQAEKITQTTTKEIQKGINESTAAFFLLIRDNEEQIDKLFNEVDRLNFEINVNNRTDLKKELNSAKRRLTGLQNTRDKITIDKPSIIAKDFLKEFDRRTRIRSEVISEFEVGSTESWSRDQEATNLNDSVLAVTQINVFKNWDATLDSRTRKGHVEADKTYHFNPIPVSEKFIVSGEELKFPRDPNGSASNIINCRCIARYSIR